MESLKLFRALEEKLKGDSQSPLTEIKKGRYGGTFAHPLIGLAYAQYLSPEFHIWCNEILIASNLITIEDGDLFTKLGEDGKPALPITHCNYIIYKLSSTFLK